MTPAEIDGIEKRANAASPEPWSRASVMPTGSNGNQSWSESPWSVINGPPQTYSRDFDIISAVEKFGRCFDRREDAEFIAHSRQDVPALIKALRESLKTNEQLVERIRQLEEGLA